MQHSTLQCNTRWLQFSLTWYVGRWDEAVEAARRRRAVALVVLHEGEVEPEPELVVEAPLQARDQLRVPRVAHLFDFDPHDTRTHAGSAPTAITTKQAENAGVGRPRCAPGWRRRRGPPGALLPSPCHRTAAGGEGEGARGGWTGRRRRRRRGRAARAPRRPPRGVTRTRAARARHPRLLPCPAAAAPLPFSLAPRGVFTSLVRRRRHGWRRRSGAAFVGLTSRTRTRKEKTRWGPRCRHPCDGVNAWPCPPREAKNPLGFLNKSRNAGSPLGRTRIRIPRPI